MRRVRTLLLGLALSFGVLSPSLASAQVTENTYLVARGDTLSTIAQRFQCSERELAERNHLQEPYFLRHNQRLRLPHNVVAPAAHGLAARPAAPASRLAEVVPPPRMIVRAPPPPPPRATPSSRWGRSRHPGSVNLVRHQSGEATTITLRRVSSSGLGRMRHFLRYPTGASHAIDPRLLRQLAVVSDHFGGRTLRVISGFRPVRRGQYTAHSNHNVGHAIDFRVDGVPNRVLRDFCRTLPNTGCGFYPRSVFVHMDTRSESAYWVDWSRPGQRPMYGSESHPPAERPRTPNAPTAPVEPPTIPVGADQELDDVADEAPVIRTDPTDPDDSNNTPTTP